MAARRYCHLPTPLPRRSESSRSGSLTPGVTPFLAHLGCSGRTVPEGLRTMTTSYRDDRQGTICAMCEMLWCLVARFLVVHCGESVKRDVCQEKIFKVSGMTIGPRRGGLP